MELLTDLPIKKNNVNSLRDLSFNGL